MCRYLRLNLETLEIYATLAVPHVATLGRGAQRPYNCMHTLQSTVGYEVERGNYAALRRMQAEGVHLGFFFTALNEYVLRVFPLCALVPRVQRSSGAVATVQFVWRGHAKTLTTRAGPWPDFALWLE